jgi:uncharacterized protein DUF2752
MVPVKGPARVAFLLLPLFFFFVVPTSWLESRRSLCLIRNVFGVRCPGCGMIRAISCAFHGNFKQAFQYNQLVVLVLPLLCYVWLRAAFLGEEASISGFDKEH